MIFIGVRRLVGWELSNVLPSLSSIVTARPTKALERLEMP
jgi:hypothetical protein